MTKRKLFLIAGMVALAAACHGPITGLCEEKEDTIETFCSTRPTLDPNAPANPSTAYPEDGDTN